VPLGLASGALIRLLLLSLPEQIIQGGIDASLVNVAPEGGHWEFKRSDRSIETGPIAVHFKSNNQPQDRLKMCESM
jgi:hypothetical protein